MNFSRSLFRIFGLFSITCALIISITQSPEVASAASCKTGQKIGKTPVSLVIGAKPGCYDVKLAAAGKKTPHN